MKRGMRILCCTAAAALLAGMASPARAQEYQLGIKYELPKNPDLASEARLAESRCMNPRTMVLQGCANGGNAAQCGRRAEIGFRECISAIPGARFNFYIWQQSERTAHYLFALTPEEAISSSLDQNFSHLQPGDTVYNLGVEAEISGDSCRFQKNADGTTVEIPDSDFFCAVVKNYAETNGASPLEVAINRDQDSVVQELLDRAGKDSSPGFQPLMYAARQGDAELVRLLYEHGSYEGKELTWALEHAVCADSEGAVSFLVEHGADPGSAVEEAASCGNGTALRYLLAHGADVKNVNLAGIYPCLPEMNCPAEPLLSPFPGARQPNGIPENKKEPRTEMIEYLVTQGADVNATKGSTGEKAGVLDFAARYESLDLVQWLVEHGALVNGKEPRTVDGLMMGMYWGFGSIPSLCEAIEGGHWDTVRYLVEQGAYVNLPCAYMNLKTPVGLALEQHRTDMVQMFLTKGRFAYAQMGGDCIDMIWAAQTGREDLLRLLIEHKVFVDATCGQLTALMEAANDGQVEIVRYLLAQGANVKLLTNGETALGVAADKNKLEIAKLLIAHGADVNERGQGHWSPLMYAAHAGNLEIAQLLLDHGAEVQLRDKDGKSALDLAVEQEHPAVATLLRQHGATQ
jgi:ankyrin repeat protein